MRLALEQWDESVPARTQWGSVPAVIDTAPAAPAPFAPRQLKVKFTGSGSEYFRIWLVNLLLSAVTLGLYLPFAKSRRLRYFYANTHIAGQPLG